MKHRNPAGLTLNSVDFKSQFGYFASIELARLHCLLGDYNGSIQALSALKLFDRSELFAQLTLCHFNVFYHNGVCRVMLGHFAEAADLFADIISLVSRILKPGAAGTLRPSFAAQLQKMLEKVLALMAIVTSLEPTQRVEDNVRDMMEAKWAEKLRKLQSGGDEGLFMELFLFSTPKFVSAQVPDYSAGVSMHQEAAQQQLVVFLALVRQLVPFLKLRSFLTLYASIDIAKLARFNDVSEADLICQLVAYKSKLAARGGKGKNDIHYHLENDILVIDAGAFNAEAEGSKAVEKFFVTGIMKHAEMNKHLVESFQQLGL
jgi:translation initiation factor 3 subunit L